MELEFFCEPGKDLEWFEYWRGFCRDWLMALGIREEEMRLRDHDPAELAFYSKATTDIEFLFPFGWGELWGSLKGCPPTETEMYEFLKTYRRQRETIS